MTLQDPNSNRIAQWLNRTLAGVGILDFSYPIIPEAPQGTYVITAVTDKGEEITHNFELKEYGENQFEHQNFSLLCSRKTFDSGFSSNSFTNI